MNKINKGLPILFTIFIIYMILSILVKIPQVQGNTAIIGNYCCESDDPGKNEHHYFICWTRNGTFCGNKELLHLMNVFSGSEVFCSYYNCSNISVEIGVNNDSIEVYDVNGKMVNNPKDYEELRTCYCEIYFGNMVYYGRRFGSRFDDNVIEANCSLIINEKGNNLRQLLAKKSQTNSKMYYCRYST